MSLIFEDNKIGLRNVDHKTFQQVHAQKFLITLNTCGISLRKTKVASRSRSSHKKQIRNDILPTYKEKITILFPKL